MNDNVIDSVEKNCLFIYSSQNNKFFDSFVINYSSIGALNGLKQFIN